MANTVDKVIAIAEAEVGYLEKKSNAQLDSKLANSGSANFTKYWKDLAPGMQGQPWCNAFVNDIFVMAYGVDVAKKLLCTNGGWSYYTPTSASYFKAKSQWYTSNPKVGDIIYFKNTTRIYHVGFVYKVDATKVYTIEGNTSNASGVVANGGGVAKKSYALTYSKIAGYGRPKYDASTGTSTTTKPTTTATQTISTAYTKSQFIKDVQSAIGVKTDGVVGSKTLDALVTVSKTKNSKHKIVLPLQKYLNALGYNCGTPDCDFGTKSYNAVISYQKKMGLVTDGVIGLNSWKKLLL